MQEIPLTNEPNQQLSVRLDNTRYTLRLKEAAGVMIVDITINDAVVLRGSRVLAGEPLIPFPYLQNGNFMLITDNDALPDYREFGLTQTLLYLSNAEIAAL